MTKLLNLCSVNPFHFCSWCARPGEKLIYEQAGKRNQGLLKRELAHLGNLYLRQRSIVSSQSSLVSVGKPAMMSVTMVNPSTLSLRKSTTLQNSATVYSLRMSPSTASLPACKSTLSARVHIQTLIFFWQVSKQGLSWARL